METQRLFYQQERGTVAREPLAQIHTDNIFTFVCPIDEDRIEVVHQGYGELAGQLTVRYGTRGSENGFELPIDELKEVQDNNGEKASFVLNYGNSSWQYYDIDGEEIYLISLDVDSGTDPMPFSVSDIIQNNVHPSRIRSYPGFTGAIDETRELK